MSRISLVLVLALVAAAASVRPAAAAPLTGVLTTTAANGPIAAYSNTAAWSRWDDTAGVYRLVVDRGGTIRDLPVAPSTLPLGVSAGRGPDGATWLVWTRCSGTMMTGAGECDVEGYDLGTRKPVSFPFAARPGVRERAPSIRDDQLVYAVGGPNDVAQVHLSSPTGANDRVIDVLPPTTCGLSIDLECRTVTVATVGASAVRGSRVAVTSHASTGPEDFGICGWATVRLLDLQTTAVRTLDDSVCGLSGQTMTDVSFDADGRLWWRLACGGDESACQGTKPGPYRQTQAGVQRLVTDAASRLAGVAVAGRTPILAVRAPRMTPDCWVGADQTAYRCTTLTALSAPSYATVPPPRAKLPPPGYLTVKGTSRLRVLQPPAKLACSRGDITPTPGATLWAGVSWVKGELRTAGPAVPVTATSGSRTVKGTVPKGRRGWEGQLTTMLDLGTPSKACGRRWTLTYRPPGMKPIKFTTRVRER